MTERLTEVGTVRKTHGVAGELKAIVYDGYEDDMEAAQFLFIGQSPERALPYEVRELRGADWIFALDGVRTREAAAELRGQVIYLKASQVTALPAVEEEDPEVAHYRKVIGFVIEDEELGAIGPIDDIVSYPQQVMAAVTYKGRASLVPLNQHFVKGIDFTRQLVLMRLPAGLLDL